MGWEDPHGETVTNPAPAGLATVTFNATAVASAATPPRPATVNAKVEPVGPIPPPSNRPSTVSNPARVSANRAEANATYVQIRSPQQDHPIGVRAHRNRIVTRQPLACDDDLAWRRTQRTVRSVDRAGDTTSRTEGHRTGINDRTVVPTAGEDGVAAIGERSDATVAYLIGAGADEAVGRRHRTADPCRAVAPRHCTKASGEPAGPAGSVDDVVAVGRPRSYRRSPRSRCRVCRRGCWPQSLGR